MFPPMPFIPPGPAQTGACAQPSPMAGYPCPPITWLDLAALFGTIPPQVYERVVQADALPFATRWIPATEVFTHETADLIPKMGSEIHPGIGATGHAGIERNLRYSLVIAPSEVIYDPANPPLTPNTDGTNTFNPYAAALDLGMPSSMLKARIWLNLGNAKQIFFDVDIGAGVLVPLETRYVDHVDVLIPDPTSVPDGAPVSEPRSLATMFRSRIICCDCVPPVPILPPVYSQLFFQAGDAVLMPRVMGAQQAQVQLDDDFGAADTALFVQVRDPFPFQAGDAPTDFIVVGSMETNTTLNTTPMTQIPGQANAILVNATGRTINVIQQIQPL